MAKVMKNWYFLGTLPFVQLTFLAYIFRVEYQHLMIVMSTYILDIFLLDSLPASDYKFSAKDILRNIFAERPTFSHPHLHNNLPTKQNCKPYC